MAEKNFYYDMNLNGGTITGIANGANATDAVTKGQLDAQTPPCEPILMPRFWAWVHLLTS